MNANKIANSIVKKSIAVGSWASRHKKTSLGVLLALGILSNRIEAYRIKSQRARRRRRAEAREAADERTLVSVEVSESVDECGKKKPVKIDRATFAKQLRALLRIVLPFKSKEFLLLLAHTGFLVMRTFLSIRVATLDGSIVKSIVDRNQTRFVLLLLGWLLMAIPATFCNSMIRFLEAKLAIAFRTRLTHWLHEKYMDKQTYYRVENLDSRLVNADQSMTQDVVNFCESLAHIHSQLSKPALDLLLMSTKLIMLSRSRRERSGGKPSSNAAAFSATLAVTIAYSTAWLLRQVSPPFGRMAARQGHLEGALRGAHSRLITNAEEIAFYDGASVEKSFLSHCYDELVSHVNTVLRAKAWYFMLEGFFFKYVWSATGLVMIALPAFDSVNAQRRPDADASLSDAAASADALETTGDRTEGFITARGLLLSLADAAERIMSSFKDINELAGYTKRVHTLVKVFDDVHDDRYEKRLAQTADRRLMAQRGVVEEGDRIAFDRVPLVTPNGDILIRSLTFSVERGQHLLISGPNGSGKSTLFRVLSALWPCHGGKLVKPRQQDLIYIPQRPYLCAGTLRQQVVYPHADDRERIDEHVLNECMRAVHLEHIVRRDGGWDAVADWTDVLSGGEKQRVALARLFYHRPKFSILDEVTSAVSEDVEAEIYERAKALGITLLTVSHRHTLWRHHSWLLQFDGEGGYQFVPLDAKQRLSMKEEKKQLEKSLSGLPAKQRRLKELCMLLGESSQVADEKMNE